MGTMVLAPGSCGELVQGQIDGVSFHISCPVSSFSRAVVVREGPEATRVAAGPKARAVAKAVLKKAGLASLADLTAALRVESDLIPGIGMASSTADITAAAAAAAQFTGVPLTAAEIAALALAIEPTDGTVFPGVVAFDHKRGSRLKPFGQAPPLDITYIDTGGTVDTVAFNRRKVKYSRHQLSQVEKAFNLAVAAFKWSDWRLLGLASTLSARINQSVLPKAGLEEMIALAAASGGFGVVVAHSGTVIGILHDRQNAGLASVLSSHGYSPRTVSLVNGGWRICRCLRLEGRPRTASAGQNWRTRPKAPDARQANSEARARM